MKLGPFDVPGYHVGDCRDLLRQLPDACIHTCVSSPPYYGLRDYGVDGQLGLEASPAEYVAAMVEVFGEVRRVLRDDGTLWLNIGDSYAGSGRGGYPGNASTLEGTVEGQDGSRAAREKQTRGARGERLANGRKDQDAVLRQKLETPTARTRAIDNLKPKDLIGIPWELAFALRSDGWWLRSDIVWEKPNPMPESIKDRPTRAHEYLFLMTKSSTYFYDADAIAEPMVWSPHYRNGTPDYQYQAPGQPAQRGISETKRRRSNNFERPERISEGLGRGSSERYEPPEHGKRNKRSVWRIATQPTPDAHFATFPEKLVEPCILAGSPAGGVVLDPFGGSGTVGRVAEDLGRRWILFDLNPAYAEIAKRKTVQTGLMFEGQGDA